MHMLERACRLCRAPLRREIVDLGMCPHVNAFVPADRLSAPETFYPLRVWICETCYLVQCETRTKPEELFSEYLYFSSYSSGWLRHAETFATMAIERFALTPNRRVVEIASNDGYLLQYFAARGIPVLGVEPAVNVAAAAKARGIETHVGFFGEATARALLAAGYAADLMPANNVLAHVPDPIDFLTGFRLLLKPDGVASFEIPHLLPMIAETQFDQVCLEHVTYLSLRVIGQALRRCGLRAFDVEKLPTHGGSLRVFACHEGAPHRETPAIAALEREEVDGGLFAMETFGAFTSNVARIKCDILKFLAQAKRSNKRVCGYGAAGKGTTFINYCGIGPELLPVTADRNPHKQGKWLPGRHIPIVAPDEMLRLKPDYVLILPWNLRREIAGELAAIRNWGGNFVVAIPELTVF